MGAGKSTFARALLRGLHVIQPAEGSPTFAIAHEYDAPMGGVVHVDFYRLRSEDEIDEAGITAYFWERDVLVVSEWISMWPTFERAVLESSDRENWRVRLSFETTENPSPDKRDVSVNRLNRETRK